MEQQSEDALIEELERLASVSSLEAYYSTDLPELHAIAAGLWPHDDSRAGRFTALRKLLEQAFDLIPDESFSYAARALFGYQDRWRSVRARGTDAGRAFDPPVSYDAFRRRDGRNYRTNTIRAVAQALADLQESPTLRTGHQEAHGAVRVEETGRASGGLVRPASLDTTATATAGDHRSSRPASSGLGRGPAIALVAVLGLALIGLAAWVARTPDSADADDLSATPLWVIEALETVSAQTSEGAAAAAVVTAELGEDDIGPLPLDMARHCQKHHAPGDRMQAVRSELYLGGWVCAHLDAGWTRAVDLPASCTEQYGPQARPVVGEQAGCTYNLDSLRAPEEWPDERDCPIPVGAHDGAAVDLDRFAGRFVQAYVAAELSEDVCASGPMHRYGLHTAGGVTQLLERNGVSFGALVADDPLNVVLLSDQVWAAYEGIRGAQVHQAADDSLEARAGYPIGPPETFVGAVVLRLTGGGALVAGETQERWSWLPSRFFESWLGRGGADGCLGLPLRTPPIETAQGSWISQDFESGNITLNTATNETGVRPTSCQQ